MVKLSKLSFKLSASIIILILFVEGVLLFVSYAKKCDQLLEMQKYEKSLYGKNLIYNKSFIDNYLQNYSLNIVLLSLLISAIVSIGFYLIYHLFVGKYLTRIRKLNNEKSPLKTKKAFRKIPDDEIGDVIKSRINMLSRIETEIANNKKLLRILSHDLANLLTISFASVAALKRKLGAGDEVLLNYLNKIEFSNLRQKELVGKVRKIDANKDKLASAEIQKHSLTKLIEESLVVFEDRLESKDITIELKNSFGDEAHVYVDRVLFVNNVLNNILSNAIKFSENKATIKISILQENDAVILEIKDQGIGMPYDMLQSIFSGGVNISRPGVNGEEGTGFGMGLLKSTLDLFNCDIDVESREKSEKNSNHGTKITIKFIKDIINEAA